MKLTNECNLPEQVYNAVKQDDYDNGGTYSATTLLKDPKEIILFDRHNKEVEEDVSDRIYTLLGTAVHYILEKNQEGENQFKEERLYCKMGKYTISGKFDLYDMDKARLYDFKTVSVWQYMMGDWEKYRLQLLIYAYILRKNGFPCNSGQIIQIYRDYSKTKAKVTSGYPKKPVQTIDFTFKEEDLIFIEKYITDKLNEIDQYIELPDDEIPECSKENRWATDDKFAVMKNGRKSAMRVLNSSEEAEKWMNENGGNRIDFREAESRKCVGYCQCKEFCNYYKEHCVVLEE